MHCILSILEGNSLEESVKNVISSYSFCSTTYCAGSDSDSTSDFQKLAEKGKVYLETVGNAIAASAVIGTGLAIGRSPEAAMVAIVRSSPHTKIVVGVALTCTQSQNRFRGCEQRHCSICGCRHRFSDK